MTASDIIPQDQFNDAIENCIAEQTEKCRTQTINFTPMQNDLGKWLYPHAAYEDNHFSRSYDAYQQVLPPHHTTFVFETGFTHLQPGRVA